MEIWYIMNIYYCSSFRLENPAVVSCCSDKVGETGWSLIKNIEFAGRRMAMGPKGLCNAGDLHTLSQQCVCLCVACIN